jgi:hypothetical protein
MDDHEDTNSTSNHSAGSAPPSFWSSSCLSTPSTSSIDCHYHTRISLPDRFLPKLLHAINAETHVFYVSRVHFMETKMTTSSTTRFSNRRLLTVSQTTHPPGLVPSRKASSALTRVNHLWYPRVLHSVDTTTSLIKMGHRPIPYLDHRLWPR